MDCRGCDCGSLPARGLKPPPPARLPSPSPRTARTRTSTASSRRPHSATATSRWSRPSSVYEYDVATGASTLLKQLEIPGGFDRTLYASERIHATAPDGVAVPISIVYRKGLAVDAESESALRLRLRIVWLLAAARIQLQPAEPARSRRGDGLRAHPRRRRPGQALARRRQNARQAQHVYRFHRLRGALDRCGLRRSEARGHRRRVGRRLADGRGREHAARSSFARCSRTCRSST